MSLLYAAIGLASAVIYRRIVDPHPVYSLARSARAASPISSTASAMPSRT
jgi:hypothetical protein